MRLLLIQELPALSWRALRSELREREAEEALDDLLGDLMARG